MATEVSVHGVTKTNYKLSVSVGHSSFARISVVFLFRDGYVGLRVNIVMNPLILLYFLKEIALTASLM